MAGKGCVMTSLLLALATLVIVKLRLSSLAGNAGLTTAVMAFSTGLLTLTGLIGLTISGQSISGVKLSRHVFGLSINLSCV